jgi:HD-GYP domain-containing protein (c-di-GMP phosphodiesterase class II)
MAAGAAVRELERCAGAQFDPAVVQAFVAALLERDDRGILQAVG